MEQMTGDQQKLAELYYRSNSVKFGEEFTFAHHLVDPEAEKPTMKLHYPKPGEPGFELVDDLIDTAGTIFGGFIDEIPEEKRPHKIAGTPDGAKPLATSAVKHCTAYTEEYLLEFEKFQRFGTGPNRFRLVPSGWFPEQNLMDVEDHMSKATNAQRFMDGARYSGFIVTYMLVVVDRCQGGRQIMEKLGVTVMPIFTIYQLLDFGVAEDFIKSDQAEEQIEYIKNNQAKAVDL